MWTERPHLSSSIPPSFARHRDSGCLLDSRGITRLGRPPSLADSSSSGSTQDLNMAEGVTMRNGIPTIEISGPGVDRSPEAGPGLGLYGRTSPSRHVREGFSGSKLAALKKKTYHVLSFGHGKDDDKGREHESGLLRAPSTDLAGFSSGKRRAASMPLPNSQKQVQMDPVATRSYLASGSPPIVDFTRFEDRYRSPSSDYSDALFSVSKGKRNDNDRKATSHFPWSGSGKSGKVVANEVCTVKQGRNTDDGSGNSGRVQAIGGNEMVRNSSSRDVLYPANERKPDPRLIMDALDNTSDVVDIQGLLNVDDLLRINDADQEDFELRAREGETCRKSRAGNARTVFGESIQNVFKYASTTIILGKREYVLPIVALHCVEEVYRTGIYQSNLFRTLPNRPRLHELISIFDSEEQPPGSIIRSRQSSPSNLEGFGAATSLHLESTPDICALLASYLSALPEPILPTNLFEAVWKLCEVDKQPHNIFPEPRPAPFTYLDLSAPVRLSSVALASSYTPRCEATYILIAQLILHLLPSPHFFLFVYLLSFFSQVALVREENGVGIEDLSKMFGARIFGHGSGDSSSDLQSLSKSSKAKGKEKERNGRGEVMMVWFLRRWGPLAETLFDVVDDAKLGVLHRNKLMRKDSLGKAAMTSAYMAAREALSTHDAIESEAHDEQEDGERDDEIENLVERELLEDGDVCGNVDLPEPVNVVGSPPTVHVPVAVDSQKRGISSPVTFAREGLDLLSLPQGNALSLRNVTGELVTEKSPQSPSASSGSSSSTLPPYTARSSPNTIPYFDPTATGYLPLATERPHKHLGEGDTDVYHSTPKKSNFTDRMLDLMNRDAGDTKCSDENLRPSREMRQDEVSGITDQFIRDGDEESTHSFPSLHERLLDVSMPISIFDFDETMPMNACVGDTLPSLLSCTPTPALSVTSKQGHKPDIISTSRIPSIAERKRDTLAFSNSPSGTLPLDLRSDRSRPSSILNNEFFSPLPAPSLPAKSSKRKRPRSQSRLMVSRSVGFQNQLGVSMPAAEIRHSDQEKAVINALRARLVEVEKERDEARRVVTEVRKALRNADDTSLHILLS